MGGGGGGGRAAETGGGRATGIDRLAVGGGGGGGGLDDIEPDIFRAAGGGREAWREIVLLLSKFGEEVTRIALLEPPPNIGGGPRELPLLRDVLLFLGGADWRAGIGAFFGGPL